MKQEQAGPEPKLTAKAHDAAVNVAHQRKQKKAAEAAGLQTAWYVTTVRCTKCDWSGTDEERNGVGGCPSCGAGWQHCQLVDQLTLHPDSVGVIAAAIGVPVEQWKGNCYGIACTMVSELKIPNARAVYGHYHGPIAPGSFFKSHRGQLVTRHGWIVMEGKLVIDPTRWVFEDVDPYLYIGEVNDEYDEGGDQIRQEWNDVRPAPRYGSDGDRDAVLHLHGESLVFVTQLMPDSPVKLIPGETVEHAKATVTLNVPQVFWLANLSRHKLGLHAVEVYQAPVDAGQTAAIPWDNRIAVLGEES